MYFTTHKCTCCKSLQDQGSLWKASSIMYSASYSHANVIIIRTEKLHSPFAASPDPHMWSLDLENYIVLCFLSSLNVVVGSEKLLSFFPFGPSTSDSLPPVHECVLCLERGHVADCPARPRVRLLGRDKLLDSKLHTDQRKPVVWRGWR